MDTEHEYCLMSDGEIVYLGEFDVHLENYWDQVSEKAWSLSLDTNDNPLLFLSEDDVVEYTEKFNDAYNDLNLRRNFDHVGFTAVIDSEEMPELRRLLAENPDIYLLEEMVRTYDKHEEKRKALHDHHK
jgi:hypothetical protein